MHAFSRLFLIGLFLLVGVSSAFAFGTGMEQGMDDHEAPALPADQVYTLSVPVFSPLFEQTPVALVKGRPIALGEVTDAMTPQDRENPDAASLNSKFNEVLDRLVAARLDGGERKDVEVLVERASPEWPGLFEGRVWAQAPEVDGVTYVSGADVAPGRIVRAQVQETTAYDLVALADPPKE